MVTSCLHSAIKKRSQFKISFYHYGLVHFLPLWMKCDPIWMSFYSKTDEVKVLVKSLALQKFIEVKNENPS